MASTTLKLTTIEYEPYNDSEQRLFKIIPAAPARIDTKALTHRFYLRAKDRPRFEQNTVIAILNSLMKKVELNRESFRVVKSEQRGPHPIHVWIEPLEERRKAS